MNTPKVSSLKAIKRYVAGLACTMFICVSAQAQDAELAEANRAIANPLTNNILFIIESDTFRTNGNIAPGNEWQNVTIVEPLIPFDIGDTGWTWVFRPIVPLRFSADIPQAAPGGGVTFDSETGLGDITFLNLFTPGMNDNGYQWGVGFSIQTPTATDDFLGSDQWSIGPSAIGLRNTSIRRPGDLTYGFIMQNFFSVAGSGNALSDDVDQTTFQYFITYSITDNWGLLTAPTIVWDRTADDEWSIPIGAGISYTTRIGSKGIPTRFVLEGQYFVESPDSFGPDWNIRLAIAMFLPKIGG